MTQVTALTAFRSAPAPAGERGRLLGAAFAERISRSADHYDQLFAAAGVDQQDAAALGLRGFENVAARAPWLAEEMDGIARGAELPLHRIAALNARTEILARFGDRPQPECSTIVHAPADGRPPVTLQTWDWHDTMRDGWFVWTVEHPDGQVVHTVTEFGIVGKIGVSSAGLGLHFNILAHASDRAEEPAEGWIPVHVAARLLLDSCTSTEEAAATALATPVAASSSLTLSDHHGGTASAAVVELCPAGSALHRPDERGYLLRTNHFTAPALTSGEVLGAQDPGTYARLNALATRTARLAAPDRAALLDVLTFHVSEGAELCCHADPALPLGHRWETLATVSLDPARGRLHLHAGTPCGQPEAGWTEIG